MPGETAGLVAAPNLAAWTVLPGENSPDMTVTVDNTGTDPHRGPRFAWRVGPPGDFPNNDGVDAVSALPLYIGQVTGAGPVGPAHLQTAWCNEAGDVISPWSAVVEVAV